MAAEKRIRVIASLRTALECEILVRYLFLEIPSQRRKFLPLLRSESRCELEKKLDGYKRTHKLKVGSKGVIIAHETSGNAQTLKRGNDDEQ